MPTNGRFECLQNEQESYDFCPHAENEATLETKEQSGRICITSQNLFCLFPRQDVQKELEFETSHAYYQRIKKLWREEIRKPLWGKNKSKNPV